MKRFVEVTAAIKSVASIIFAGLIIVYTVFGGFFGLKEISFSLVWQALFISAIAAVLHFAVFQGTERMGFAGKLLAFGLPLLAVITGFAYFFKWFPADSARNWFLLTALYLFFFGVIAVVFNLYFRVTGKKYTELLNAYRRELEK